MNHQEPDVPTRKVIVTLLKTKGPQSVGELSRQLGITEMAVRRHLNTLERDSLIESKLVRQAMGRPTHLYSLAPAADDLFPKKYQHLTLDLLEELEAIAGQQQVDLLFERRKERLIGRYEDRMKGKPLADKVRELADIQHANGYMVNLETTENGVFLLQEHNCPISQVANQYTYACSCELAMFQDLLGSGAAVERTECLAKGGNKCTYVIQQLEER
ncbi:Predicted transcriptional regulator, ArsR family [Paenibacillus sp. UNCCL117]|uniref:helix-turn-helix transcriptional regulator n=1 Tax=unclassified Paenibacillus TaxID=185978 RepID=UPI000880BB04|nr:MULTISPECIES: metalloregulator ArsR/SmtB family transcription factor [unclassified Paenibacillus]SDC19127.1 Predicted transcriptional regulator, ArsR family [Paenibacillus sp. cl123]SFW18331.1 Predicted transcriptional regulator, ArsR family [Paenibacillus sp. UNCCL117]